MKKIKINLMLTMIMASLVTNIFANSTIGTTSAQFLKFDGSARISAMGGVVAGISNDASNIFGNPAGINYLQNKEVSLMYSILYEGISYNNVGYVHPIENIGNFGLGIRYVNYGELEGLDVNGNPTTNFSPTDLAITISYARKIKWLNLGTNIKYISSKITNTATAIAVDLGIMKNDLLDKKLSAGLVIQNLGTKIKYNTEEESLPMNIKFGVGYNFRKNLLFGLDISLPNDNNIVVAIGGEYEHKINNETKVLGRLGYTTITKDIEGGLKGVSIGLGTQYKNLGFDYAFVPYGDLGQTHRISFSFKF